MPRAEERGGDCSTPQGELSVGRNQFCAQVSNKELQGSSLGEPPGVPPNQALGSQAGFSKEVALKLRIPERIRINHVKWALTSFLSFPR